MSQVEVLSFVTSWGFEFYHNWIFFSVCHKLSFWVLSLFFSSVLFYAVWDFEFGHNWSFWVLSQVEFSKHRPSGPMLSISRNVRLSVRLSVCPCVCLFTFEVPFNGLLLPLPEVGCQIFLEIWNPWGKVMERSGLTFEHFCLKMV